MLPLDNMYKGKGDSKKKLYNFIITLSSNILLQFLTRKKKTKWKKMPVGILHFQVCCDDQDALGQNKIRVKYIFSWY